MVGPGAVSLLLSISFFSLRCRLLIFGNLAGGHVHNKKFYAMKSPETVVRVVSNLFSFISFALCISDGFYIV